MEVCNFCPTREYENERKDGSMNPNPNCSHPRRKNERNVVNTRKEEDPVYNGPWDEELPSITINIRSNNTRSNNIIKLT